MLRDAVHVSMIGEGDVDGERLGAYRLDQLEEF